MTSHNMNPKEWLQAGVLACSWKMARMLVRKSVPVREAQQQLTLLIPADPFSLIGSRGDSAMLEGARDQTHGAIKVATSDEVADRRAVEVRMPTERLVFDWLLPFRMARLLERMGPTRVLVMGADVMDGHYSPVHSVRLLICADLAARSGADTRFLGFSLNDRVHPGVAAAFRRLSANVRVQLRDPLSFDRYQQLKAPAGSRLVADTAFLLQPADLTAQPLAESLLEVREAVQWIAAQQAAGRQVVGVNLHGMLYPVAGRAAQLQQLLQNVCAAMRLVTEHKPVSWLVIPHDDRPAAGDLIAAAELCRLMPAGLAQHVHALQFAPPAAGAKALVGHLDGVITARMHLAIATLGKGRPVLVLTYQAKFEGLLQHFGLDDSCKLEPAQTLDAATVQHAVAHFVEQIGPLTRQVAERLPHVKALANSTFQ